MFARADIDRRSSANSLLAVSSKELKLFGNLIKIPASTIRALLLEKKQELQLELRIYIHTNKCSKLLIMFFLITN